ncbi:hypothetical protein HCH_02977 [Hahella chejuensis KCTC 2396]|uniref:Uncharacterized protein n=1 Tax=Hahella chejuensis (strain KCTC 2396) TaxID=349521 RepID=Q2SHX8_HAHCH|nr:hypothetical protein HCH_02977 [Hahella chejuensis KCTC 2396]
MKTSLNRGAALIWDQIKAPPLKITVKFTERHDLTCAGPVVADKQIADK